MRLTPCTVVVAAAAALVTACSPSVKQREVRPAPQPLTVPAGFQDQIVVGGLVQPTAVRFARDGRVFIAEKSGLIKLFDPRIEAPPVVFADLRTNVHNYWDRGLVDLELHPDFPDTPYVYVLYTFDAELGGEAPRWGAVNSTTDRCPTPPGPTANGCVVSGRLSRLEAGEDAARGPEEVLIENWPQQFPSHTVASMPFGPDGMLYVSAGDGASFDFIDYGQVGDPPNPLGDPPARGGAVRAQTIGPAGFPVNYNGKVVRVDPETGRAAPGNPLEDHAVPGAGAIIATGFRNPFRMTFRPGTNELWIGDVGWGLWEEIDRLTDPLGTTAENFGWPCFESTARQAGYEAANLSACTELYASGAHVAPYYAYSHTEEVAPADGCGAEGQGAITGLAFYTDGLYPAEYRGALFFADYARNCIWAMLPGDDGLPDPDARQLFVFGAPKPVQLLIGPGNDLYYVSLDGALHRIASLGTNQPPVARITATPASGAVPLAVTFDGSGSSDPDPGDTLTFAWDLDGDGSYDDGQAGVASFVYSSAGDRTASLRVVDSRGAMATATATVSAGDAQNGLQATIDTLSPLTFRVGELVQFSGHGTDAGAQLPAANLRWDLVVQHCPAVDACHPHVVESFEGVETGSFIAPEHDYPYYLELILRVSGADGREATSVARLDPLTIDVTLESDPPGLPLALNDAVEVAPVTTRVVVGARNTVTAPAQAGYQFEGWSNGGEQAQLLTAAGDLVLVARYAIDATPAPLEHFGTVSARVTEGAGGGSRTPEVIRDDDMPAPGTNDAARQFDTWTPDPAPKADWIGYEFPADYVFSHVVFQEGLNFLDGGWFEQLSVRVRRDGVWSEVAHASVTPLYPGTSDHVGFRTYRIDFEAVRGDGIQLYGPAGGSAHFVSVAELDVFGRRAADGGGIAPLSVAKPPAHPVLSRELVTLDGRASFDPAGEPLAYVWTQTSGPAVTLIDPSAPLLQFVALEPASGATLAFSLTVSAGSRESAAALVDLEIPARADLVDLSARGRVIVSEREPRGGGARDVEVVRDGIRPPPDSAEYLAQFDTFTGDRDVIEGWVGYEFDRPYRLAELSFQEGGDFVDGGFFTSLGVELRREGRWFPAPNSSVTPEYPAASDGTGFETYRFAFTPTLADGIRVIGQPGGVSRFFSVAELRCFATNSTPADLAPVAAAGADFDAPSGGMIALDGSASFDPDASPLRFRWRQTGGPEVSLGRATSASPVFPAPEVDEVTQLTFELTVSDGMRSSDDDVTVTLAPGAALDLSDLGAVIASTRLSHSGQSGGLATIRDGVMPPLTATDATLEFDTWVGKLTGEGFIGYQLPADHTFTQLVFQEGLHFPDGGWFASLGVQVRRAGLWRDVADLQSTPPYPAAHDGQGFQTYTFDFEPAVGDAIRIAGLGGGVWNFFTVAELRVFGY